MFFTIRPCEISVYALWYCLWWLFLGIVFDLICAVDSALIAVQQWNVLWRLMEFCYEFFVSFCAYIASIMIYDYNNVRLLTWTFHLLIIIMHCLYSAIHISRVMQLWRSIACNCSSHVTHFRTFHWLTSEGPVQIDLICSDVVSYLQACYCCYFTLTKHFKNLIVKWIC